MAIYTSTSSYFTTNLNQSYLDIFQNRPIPRSIDDIYFTINQTYQYRPDLLAYDLYQDTQLWWVFYQRNPNTLTAPPWDFSVNTNIYVPKLDTLRSALGF
jgi:hypothetical protein